MKKLIQITLIPAAGFCLFAITPLFAAPYVSPSHTPHGIYINAGVGANYYGMKKIESSTIDKTTPKTTSQSLNDNKILGTKPSYTLAIGYASPKFPTRVELAFSKINELNFHSAKFFKTDFEGFNPDVTADISSTTVMLIGYLDLMMQKRARIMPYFTVGIGYADNQRKFIIKADNEKKFNKPSKAFAWQVGVGSRFRLTDNFYADLKLQYINLDIPRSFRFESAGTSKFDLKIGKDPLTSLQALLSLTYFFGDQSEPGPSLINDDM